MRLLCAFLAATLAGNAAAAGTADDFTALVNNSRVTASLRYLREDDAATLREQVAITQIPAPPFMEATRAKDYAGRLRAAGLTDVSIDATGNVIGKRKGTGKGPLLVLSAHLDTVFPDGTDVTVKERDGRHYAPGIADDSRGLVALLSVLRAMHAHGLATVGDVWFVGTVGEEALGNLRGVKALFQQHPHIDGFISVDGWDSPDDAAAGRTQIVTQATGSRRWEVSFAGPGGHSFENFGNPSAVHAMGRAIAQIADLKTSADPKTTFNVGKVAGGTGVTAIAAEATMAIDIRSNDAQQLAALEQRIFAAVTAAVDAENARWNSGEEIRTERKLVGDRPAATRVPHQALVEAATGAYLALGLAKPVQRFASTDSNVPLGLGIPAATIHGGGVGDKAHSTDEWYQHVNAWQGPQAILLTTLRLVGLKGVSKPTLPVRPRTPAKPRSN
jgi:acetylornithine deacetylase/succinyl-diaminopimelate desuccinylase-like protein